MLSSIMGVNDREVLRELYDKLWISDGFVIKKRIDEINL
jgi:hypothetical protein